MSDSSKAEKIAAAKKKLKQFQSKAKAETISTSVQSSVPIEYNVSANGDRKQNEISQFYQPAMTPTPPLAPSQPASLSSQSVQEQSVNLHFGAIDPVQFDSTKIFDQSQIGGNFFNQSSNKSETGLNLMSHTSINSANIPIASVSPSPPPPPPPPSIQPEIMQQPTIETFSHVSMLQQQQQQLQQTNPSFEFKQPNTIGRYPPIAASMAETANDSVALRQNNQELNDLLQVEKMRNHELSVKVTQQHSTIETLTNELNELRKCANSITTLQQQVNAHIQTVNILVGEKSDLTGKLQQRDQRIAEYESECVELQGRLKASRHRVAELEKDLNTLTQSHQKYDGSQQALCTELETLQEENKRLKRFHQEACDENTECQHQLAQKTREIDELKTIVGTKSGELEMARVRLEQLTGGESIQSIAQTSSSEYPSQDQQQQQQQQRLLDAERQVIELQNMISELTNDRDRTQQQYQTYVQHLTSESTTLTQRIQELTKLNEKLTKREASLVNHVQELEKQIQKQISTQRRLAALRDEETVKSDESSKDGSGGATANDGSQNSNEQLIALQEKLQAIEKEKSDLNALLQDHSTQKITLQQQLLEKETKLAEIESELERLKADRPDTTNLLASIESDKVAASRAMAQNQELRKQLEEMQHAFVQVSNDKLELASQLQSEEYMNRDIRNRFGDLDNELKLIKEKLHFKDEEMIRLSHENEQFEAKVQELLKKLDTNSNDSVRQVTEIQKKLHIANKEIHRLRQKLQNNESKADDANETNNDDESLTGGGGETGSTAEDSHQHKHKSEHEHEHGHDEDHHHDHDHCNRSVASYDDAAIETSSAIEALDNSDVVSVTSTINIATNEAMDKLQARFKRTMNEIADLTEEKSRLEHLVTQLQSETETIGEYIALYQKQRLKLKQRELEKDVQLNRIAADRESMRDKLRQLNELVELLLTQKGFSNAKEIMAKLNTTTTTTNNLEKSENGSADINKNASPEHITNTGVTSENNCQHQHHHHHHHGNGQTTNHEHGNNDHNHSHATIQTNPNINDDANTRETATKIINLLTDIKEKNLRQDYTIGPNAVDHCSCCSGKLEVV